MWQGKLRQPNSLSSIRYRQWQRVNTLSLSITGYLCQHLVLQFLLNIRYIPCSNSIHFVILHVNRRVYPGSTFFFKSLLISYYIAWSDGLYFTMSTCSNMFWFIMCVCWSFCHSFCWTLTIIVIGPYSPSFHSLNTSILIFKVSENC